MFWVHGMEMLRVGNGKDQEWKKEERLRVANAGGVGKT
jgi:hypothetical protein